MKGCLLVHVISAAAHAEVCVSGSAVSFPWPKMETLYSIPFTVLECPNIKLKKPSWLHMPSAMTVYAAVIVSYFLITGGKRRMLMLMGMLMEVCSH